MNGIVIRERCPYCTKFRSPRDLIRQPGGVTICLDCEQRHLEAMRAMQTGNFLGECSECGTKYDELKLQGRCGPKGQMSVHFENGKYRVVCLVCDPIYVRKRRELYGQTEFGHSIGLN